MLDQLIPQTSILSVRHVAWILVAIATMVLQHAGIASGQVETGACDGACCLPDGSCVTTTWPDCFHNRGGTFYFGASCGAFCDTTGTCCILGVCVTGLTSEPCYARGGVMVASCGACPSEGSCCDTGGAPPGCGQSTALDCKKLGLDFTPGGICGPVGLCVGAGACCFSYGCRYYVDESQCETAGGTFLGAGSSCYNAPCVGACCTAAGCCFETGGSDCLSQNGTFAGNGTTCADASCGLSSGIGACCFGAYGNRQCIVTTSSHCVSVIGGTFRGSGTTCTSTTCVCRGDFNNDGARNTLDLNTLLANFGMSVPPYTMGDMNGDGVVNTSDLTAFMSVFGTPCP